MDGCNMPLAYEYSRYLFYSSFSIGISSLVCMYYEDSMTFAFMFLLFLSSIHFWYKPDYGLFRNLDMFLCKCLVFYFYIQLICYYEDTYRDLFTIGFMQIMTLYAIELWLYAQKNTKWIILHMSMHLYFSMIIPCILYIF